MLSSLILSRFPLSAIFPNLPIFNLREFLKSEGYGEQFLHGLGHGVGLDVHEPPTLSSRSEDVLKEGNVVTVEPGIYIVGFGGVRIEDTVLVHKNYGERLTQASYYL